MATLNERVLFASHYEGVYFPVVSVTTSGGHDGAKHKAPGRKGADCEPTGQREYDFRYRIAMLNELRGDGLWDSDLYPAVYRQLIEAFERHPKGTLQDPVRGPVRVMVDRWVEHWDPTVQNGLYLDVDFTEDDGDSSLEAQNGALPDDPQASASARAAEADAAAVGLSSSPLMLADRVASALQALEDGPQLYRDVSSTIGSLVALSQGNLSTVSADGIAAGPYRLAVERLIASLYDVKEAIVGLTRPQQFTVPEDMSLARIAALAQVYGDPSKASVLRAANAVPDPMLVPAGTVLDVPPVA